MPSPLELRHLRTLLALSRTGSVSAAADEVHLTQSAVSHQLKLLESWYDLELFLRKSQPLRFSAAGERLLQLADAVQQLVIEAERDLAKQAQGEAGVLRIAVECSTCFDWLMPAMDEFREHWPEVELDILSGFHQDPVPLVAEQRAEVAITGQRGDWQTLAMHPLFGFEMVGLVGRRHRLAECAYLTPADFATETLVSYPVPDELLDVMRNFLLPAGVQPPRRTTELTVGLLQLVASRRGIAALPLWSVQGYVERGYVLAKRLGEKGLFGELFAVTRQEAPAYVADFIATVCRVSFANLSAITPLKLEK